MREFKARYETTVKVISIACGLLLLGIALALRVIIADVIVVLVFVISFAYSPLGYAIDGRWLTIKRLAGKIQVPLTAIREARPGSADDFKGSIRVAGSGGLFGYYGLFRTSRLGNSSWYVTDRSRAVVVRLDSKTFVVSPDDVAGFLSALNAPAAGAPPVAAPAGTRHTGAIAGVALALATAIFIGIALVYAPGIPSYTVDNGALTIHDRFYPVTLPLAGIDAMQISIVDLSQDPEWRPVLRTNGFANQHYQSGWYRVRNGKQVRMYRTSGNRLVLIPPKGQGTYVLYQAANPEQLVAQLRDAASIGGARR